MRTIPTREEIRRRWLETPWKGLCRGARWTWGKYRAHPFPLTGFAIGLFVPLLGLLYLQLGDLHELVGHHGNRHSSHTMEWLVRVLSVPFAFTMLFGWILSGLDLCPYHLASLTVCSTTYATSLFWVAGRSWAWCRRGGVIGRLILWGAVLAIVAGYAWTWRTGTEAVRQSIRAECARAQVRGHKDFPKDVPSTPIEPDLYYCFPILPGVVVSEYCFYYGPLMGFGEQTLWVWDGCSVRDVGGWMMWNH